MAVRRILIADDDGDVRETLKSHLERMGHSVVAECANGREVVETASSARPDVMILDIKMPELDGIEAAKQVQNVWACPIVFLTGFTETELVESASEAGAIGYLVKPFRAEELGPAIEVAIKRFGDMQQAGNEVEELKRALETRKLLDRAKAHLMNTQGMSEDEAFKFIHFGARNSSRTMRDIAVEVLQKAGQQV